MGRLGRARRWLLAGLCALPLAAGCSESRSQSPTAPTTPGSVAVFYTAIGASDAAGAGASVQCPPLTACTDGTGYVPTIARRLRAAGRDVTLLNLALPSGVLSPDVQALANSLGRQVPWNFLEQAAPFVPPTTTLVTIFAGGNDVNTIALAIGAGRGGNDPSGYLTQQVQAFARDYSRLIDVVRSRAPSAQIVVLNLPNFAALPYVASRSASERRIIQDVAVRLTTEAINPLSGRVLVVDIMCDGRSYDPGIYSGDGFHPNDAGYAYLADVLLAAITSGNAPAPASRCSFMTLAG